MRKDYIQMQRKVVGYKTIFLFLGILFSILTALLFFKVPNWNFSLILGYGLATKVLISLVTANFALASLWLGCHPRTEFELAKKYYEDSLNSLDRHYRRARGPFHLGKIITATAMEAKESLLIKEAYYEEKERMEKLYQEVFHALDQVNHRVNLSETSKKSLRLQLLSQFKESL